MSKRLRSLAPRRDWRRPRSPAALAVGGGRRRRGHAARRTITVVGTGEVRGTPDVADLVLGRLRVAAATAADVMRTIGDRAQKVIDALRDAGVADDDIQTDRPLGAAGARRPEPRDGLRGDATP